MGFITPDRLLAAGLLGTRKRLTAYGTNSSTPPKVVHDSGVALDDSIHGQIATKPGIGDVSIFHTLDSDLNCIDS